MTGCGRVGSALLSLSLCLVCVLLAGCGSGRAIAVDAGAQALHSAGFTHTYLQRHHESDTAVEGEIDIVDVVAPPARRSAAFIKSAYWPSARLIDYDSDKRAAAAFKGRFTSARWHQLAADPPCALCGRLPAGFAADKVRAYRICNVIFWSYNAAGKPAVTARVSRAVKLLRADCR